MAVVYSIRDWADNFEVAQSRKVDGPLSWVALPCKHDGLSYRRIMSMQDGTAIYGAWVLIVQVAAKCIQRGVLADATGPIDAEALGLKTGAPPEIFQRALKVLSSDKIAWLLVANWEPGGSQVSYSTEQNTTEHNRTEQPARAGHSGTSNGDQSLLDEFVLTWNEAPGVVPIRKLSAARKSKLLPRLREDDWDWRAALAKFPLKCFQGHPQGWRPDFDFIVRPDTVTKILEGKYDWTRADEKRGGRKVSMDL